MTGRETAWPPDKAVTWFDFKDRRGTTILLIEIADSSIDWSEPRDVSLEDLLAAMNGGDGPKVSCHCRARPQVLMADGSVNTLPDDLTAEDLRALCTIAGGETIGPDLRVIRKP